jgi:cbb3-type cytochrome oxidase subunit 3
MNDFCKMIKDFAVEIWNEIKGTLFFGVFIMFLLFLWAFDKEQRKNRALEENIIELHKTVDSLKIENNTVWFILKTNFEEKR